jgi:hypothetical protein
LAVVGVHNCVDEGFAHSHEWDRAANFVAETGHHDPPAEMVIDEGHGVSNHCREGGRCQVSAVEYVRAVEAIKSGATDRGVWKCRSMSLEEHKTANGWDFNILVVG